MKELFVKLDLTENAQRLEKNAQSTVEEIRYLQGLIMGLFLGILGNLSVSFLMKAIDVFGTTSLNIWLGAFVLSLVMTVVIFLLLARRIVMLILSFFKPFRSIDRKQKTCSTTERTNQNSQRRSKLSKETKDEILRLIQLADRNFKSVWRETLFRSIDRP